MRLVLQTANVVSDAKNCLYPNRVEAGNAAELQEAIKKDHVCGEYRKNYRSKENFIRSNVAVMDCDNDHSEDPEEWITSEKMEELFGGEDGRAVRGFFLCNSVQPQPHEGEGRQVRETEVPCLFPDRRD